MRLGSNQIKPYSEEYMLQNKPKKSQKVAIVDVARKLATIVYQVLKRRSPSMKGSWALD